MSTVCPYCAEPDEQGRFCSNCGRGILRIAEFPVEHGAVGSDSESQHEVDPLVVTAAVGQRTNWSTQPSLG